MTTITAEDLRLRISRAIKEQPEKSNGKDPASLTIEEVEGGFKIGDIVCTSVPKKEAVAILLAAHGLSNEQSGKKLNVGAATVSARIKQFRLRILGSNVDGNADGEMHFAIMKAFEFAYMYLENMSVFSIPQEYWDFMVMALNQDGLNKEEVEVARRVFVEGQKIQEAAEGVGIDLDRASKAIRDAELRLGQGAEILFHEKTQIDEEKLKKLMSNLLKNKDTASKI